ncbi:MAG: hypothetical protein ACT4PQ_11430 [Betaproteobacteria bacterium]
MNYKAVFFAGWLLAPAVGWISAPLSAEMIREGRFDFDICKFGKADYPWLAKGLVSGSFDRIAASIYDNGRPKDIDRGISRCVGAYEVVGGRYRDYGVCTQVDADGDQWRMRYETGADLIGTWVAMGGSGKYEGITAKGEYRPVGNVPGVMAGGFKSCNHNTGSYRLK